MKIAMGKCFRAVLLMQLLAASAMAQTTATSAVKPATSAPALSSTGSLMQVMLGLALVLALMFGVAWVMKRFGMTRTTGVQVVRLVGGVSVGNRERVLVVEVNDQWIVVGVAPGRVNALATLPKGSDAMPGLNAQQTPAKNFSAWLNQKMNAKQSGASEHGAS